jgi:serine/threonine-protein kinase
MTLESGSEFSGYTILGEIGRGGMGTVYAAQHPRLPRQDALKVLNPDLSGSEDFRQRFIREADIAARLDHPNIVHVYDRGEIDGQLWIATQFIDGIDVARLLYDRYPAGMPVEDALPIIRAIASALDYAHSHGMLHRDVKPANIILSQPRPDGQRHVYLADFGIARPLTDPNGLTATNLTLGTVAYAAPEQLMGTALNHRADEYALACTAFHLLTGAPPYNDPNSVAVISQHLNAPVPLLSSRRADLASMNSVFDKALAKNPQQRFGSCLEFSAALNHSAGRVAIGHGFTQAGKTVAAPPPPYAAGNPTKPGGRGRVALIPAAALAGVGALVAAGMYFVNGKAPVPEQRLDGTYRLVYDISRETFNGVSPASTANKATASQLKGFSEKARSGLTTDWAYRSVCLDTGCVATGIVLDGSEPPRGAVPTRESTARFVSGEWVFDHQRSERNCSNGLLGKHLIDAFVQFREKPDGTLEGTHTETVLTTECFEQGLVYSVPIVGERTGEVPSDIAVPDPAKAQPQTESSAAEPQGSPNLNGVYRLEFQSADRTETTDGRPTTRLKSLWPGVPQTLALRSLCTDDGCAAVSVLLRADFPASAVFLLSDKKNWIAQPNFHILTEAPCPADLGLGTKTHGLKTTRSFQIQEDGTLVGKDVELAVTNGCGLEGVTLTSPFIAKREGDIPPDTVLAEPALFLS